MIRNVLIAIYILAVLAISAVAKAQFAVDLSKVNVSFDSKVMVTH